MTEDTLIRDELDALVGETRRVPNWDDVVRRARPPMYRRPLVLLLVVLVAVTSGAVVAAATGGFGKWLTGQPGKPAPAEEQKRFKAENGQTWLAFPTGTKLRELLRAEVAGEKYVLYGFRSGDSLCLRLNATVGEEPILGCAPASTVARTSVPVVPVVGNGSFAERNSPAADALVSFGIVADGIGRVNVHTVEGVQPAVVGGNAYLFVRSDPNTGSRVLKVTAFDNAGQARTVALADWRSPWFMLTSSRPARGPKRIEAPIKNPRVGWFARKEKRGYSLADIPLTPEQRSNLARSGAQGFLRLFKPDPLSNRVVGLAGSLCLVSGSGGSGCSPASDFFSRAPLNVLFTSTGSSEFLALDGAAADGVARVAIYSADGRSQSAPLRDNMFTALVPIAGFPIRVVGFDRQGRVAGILTWPGGSITGTPPAAKKLHYVYDVFGAHGTRGIVRAGRQVDGYRCWRFSFSSGASLSGCRRRVYNQHLSVERIQPVGRDLFVVGFADKLVTRVEVHFANGDVEAAPVVAGTFLLPIPRQHLKPQRQVAYAVAYDHQNHRPQRRRIVFRVLR
jgi:hypothetical protein